MDAMRRTSWSSPLFFFYHPVFDWIEEHYYQIIMLSLTGWIINLIISSFLMKIL